jgi:hypothetical protein
MQTGWTRRHVFLGLVLAGAPTLAMTGRARSADLPRMVVTKDPSCGCCTAWAEHVRAAGFPVEIVESTSVNRLKARLGVPQDLAGCHTAEVGGYVVEGHVPAAAIRRLLEERPAALGLAVPGMPVGSPGMEVEGSPPDTYEVVLFGPSGRRRFARYRGAEEV